MINLNINEILPVVLSKSMSAFLSFIYSSDLILAFFTHFTFNRNFIELFSFNSLSF